MLYLKYNKIACFVLIFSFIMTFVHIRTAYSYTIKDVDDFIAAVRANPSPYGADFLKGDEVYKEQFTQDEKVGYRVYLLKNNTISQKFLGWQIRSEGPCSDGWPTYWENRIYTDALLEVTYKNGTIEKKLDTNYQATAARELCVLFDEQEAYAGRFGVCFGAGSIVHNIHYVCNPGSPYYDETVGKIPQVPPSPPDQTFPPEPPILLREFFPVDSCNLKITGLQGSKSILDPVSGGSVSITGTITEGSGKPITWTMTVAGKPYPGTGSPAQVTWDGRNAYDKVVDAGSYSATLTAQAEGGQCSKSETISFTVTDPPDGQCGFTIVDFGSSAHVANGNLSHSQELFSARGIGPELGLTQ